ncbi:MAG: tetratricopeptide repeat protein [bacterium]
MAAAARSRNRRAASWPGLFVLAAGLALLAVVLLLALRPQPGATVAEARDRLARHQVDQAVDVLNRVLTDRPNDTRALLLRGRCHLAHDSPDYQAARRDFRRVLELAPGDPEARLGLVRVDLAALTARPRHQQAPAAFQAIIRSARDIAEAHPERLGPYAVIGRAHHALFTYHARQAALILEDAGGGASVEEAVAGVLAGRFRAAETFCDEWRAREPDAGGAGLREHLDAAREHFALALDNLETACGTEDGPGRPEAELFLAELFLCRGELEQAVARADRAMKRPGADVARAAAVRARAVDEQAEQLAAAGQADDAERLTRRNIEFLQPVLRENPDAGDLRELLAAQYVRLGRYDEAADVADYRADPARRRRGRYVLALSHLGEGRYDAAAAELSRIRSLMEDDPRFDYAFGLALSGAVASNAPEQAIEQFQHVVLLRPGFLPARFHLARLYVRKGWFGRAKEQCERILDTPNRPQRFELQVCLLLSEVERGLRNYDEVIPWLRQAAGLAPTGDALLAAARLLAEPGTAGPGDAGSRADSPTENDPSYLCLRGYVSLDQKKLGPALENFKRAATLDPEYLMAYVHMANAHESAGQLDQAVEVYKEALNRNERLVLAPNAALHFGLAVLSLKQERLGPAATHLQQALEIDDGHAASRVWLADLHLRRGELEAALNQVRTVIYAGEDRADLRFAVALIQSLRARQSDDEIRQQIRGSARLTGGRRDVSGDDIESERRHRWDRAARQYERALRLDPDFRYFHELVPIHAMQAVRYPVAFHKMAQTCRRALRDAPSSARPRLRRQLAAACLAVGLKEKAIEAARLAVQLAQDADPVDEADVLRSRFVLANCLLGAKQFGEARAEAGRLNGAVPGFKQAYTRMVHRLALYAAAPERHPRRGVAMTLHKLAGRDLSLALLFSRSGAPWHPFARDLYGRIVRKEPGAILPRQFLAELYVVASRLRAAVGDEEAAAELIGKAEEVSREIIGVAPGYPLAYRNLAVLAELRSRAEAAAKDTPDERLAAQARAIALYQKAIAETKGRFWLPLIELAAICQRAGADDKAAKLYERVVELDPQPGHTLCDYGNVYGTGQDELTAVLEHARQIRKDHSFDRGIVDTLEILVPLLAEPEQGAAGLQHPCPLLPNNPSVLYHLARAYAKADRKEQALRILDSLLEGGVRFPERSEAMVLRNLVRP